MSVELHIGDQCQWANNPIWNYRDSEQEILDDYELYRMSRTPDRLDIFLCSANSNDISNTRDTSIRTFLELERPVRERFFCLANQNIRSRFLDLLSEISPNLIDPVEGILEIETPIHIRTMNIPVRQRHMRMQRDPAMEMRAIDCEPYHRSDVEVFNRAIHNFRDIASYLGIPEYRTYPNIESALKSLGDQNEFQINAWGEIHFPKGYDKRITMDIFSQEFIPYLRANRRKNLVTEFIPTYIPEQEIGWITRGNEPDQEHTPDLIAVAPVLSGFSHRINMLQSCGRNNLHLLAGGYARIDYEEAGRVGNVIPMVAGITRNSIRAIRNLAENDQTADFYGGIGHIQINDNPLSFGQRLSSQYSYRAIEIIEIGPLSDMLRSNIFVPLTFIDLGGITVYPNTIGVVKHNDNYYTIIIPE